MFGIILHEKTVTNSHSNDLTIKPASLYGVFVHIKHMNTLTLKTVMLKTITPNRKVLIFCALFLITALLPTLAFSSTIFKDFNGAFHTIDDYKNKGNWLVVMLWASDCHVCNQEAHEYVAFHNAHSKKDAQVLGISLDGENAKAEAVKFIQRHNINFPNLIAEPEVVAQMYQALTGNAWVGTPTFLVYGPDGELRGQQAGAVPTSIIESFISKEATNSK